VAVEVEEDDAETVLKPRLVHVDDDDWREFQRRVGKGRVSARIRELVREDNERG
jgi:hypothetical protein